MDQRLDFVREAMTNRFTMVELCARYGVSQRIGYKWLARFAEEGRRGLADRTRRPHTCPTAIRPVLAELLCEFRRLHPDRGARKLLRVLRDPIRKSRTGSPRARRPSSSPGAGWCAADGVGARISIRVWCGS